MNFKVYYSGKCLNFFICFVLLSKITFMNLGFLLLFSHLSCVWLFVTSRKAAHQASLSFTSPRACSNSWLLSRWCHPNTSPSVTLFSSCPQSFPIARSFPMSWLFTSGGQSTGASASASVLPMSIQGWFPLGLTSLISLLSKGVSRVFSSITIWKHQFFSAQPSHCPTLTSVRDFWKNHSFDYTGLFPQRDMSAF